MLALIGLLIIITIVLLLMTGKTSPVIAMSLIPFIGALLTGFSLGEISLFFEHGLRKVTPVATMFLFAILFFSIMNDKQIFTPLINRMVKITRGNVIAVCVITTLVAGVVHLDGSGAATFLIIIPAFLPLYQRLGMSPYLMLLLMSTSMGIMNMVPWGGPLGRASSVTGIDLPTLWRGLIPIQLVGIAGAMVFAALMGLREQRRIARAHLQGTTPYLQDSLLKNLPTESAPSTQTPTLCFILNVVLIISSIIVLALGLFSAPYLFMIVLALALLLNYPQPQQQLQVIAKHAPQALSMAAIILAAGAFLGILTESGMLKALANNLTNWLPVSWLAKLHIVIGIFGVPMDLFTSTDAYYFALLPIVQETTAQVGVSSSAVVYAMTIGNNAGTFVSPFSPAAWLATGIAGIEMGKHLRYSFGWIWLFSLFPFSVAYWIGLF